MTSTYGGQLQGIKISTRTKIMRFFVTLSFLTLEIIRYGCKLALAQLPSTAEMTNSTGVGKCSCQQERYKRGASSFEEAGWNTSFKEESSLEQSLEPSIG